MAFTKKIKKTQGYIKYALIKKLLLNFNNKLYSLKLI